MIKETGLLRWIYLFVLVASIVMLGILVNNEWKNLKHESFSRLGYLTHLNSSALHNELAQISSLLRILGRRSLQFLKKGDRQSAQELIDSLLQENSNLAGFGLADPEGNLILTSSNLKSNQKTINLLKQKGSAESFRQSLKHNGLLLGRSYYFKPLSRWIIPLRYTLRDTNNRVLAVMTTGIDIDNEQNVWNIGKRNKDIRFIVVREDYYVQYISNNSVFQQRYQEQGLKLSNNPHPEFLKPYPEKYVRNFIQIMQQQTGMSLEALKQGNKIIQLETLNLNKTPVLMVIQFDKKFRFFSIAYSYRSTILNKLIYRSSGLLIIFFIFNIILYFLFRYLQYIQKLQRQELSHQARYDALTGLPNRYFLQNEFDKFARKHHDQFAVLFLDLDNFKDINDSYGHNIGDSVLIAVSQRIKECLPENYRVFRHGGDEFIILSPDSSLITISQFAAKLTQQLRQPVQQAGMEFSITCSMGLVTAPEHGTKMDDLLRKADMSMYEAKRHKNRFMVFNYALEEKSKRRILLEKEIRLALERDEFYVVYQPQICANTGRLTGIEALLRWDNSQLGSVGPIEFIPVAESIGLIQELSQYVFHQSLNNLAQVHKFEPSATLSINICAQLLTSGFLKRELETQLQEVDFDASKLVLEVTESAFIDNIQKAVSELITLRAKGIRISLDDFGTGYSSLSLLTSLPIDELKIDAAFIRGIFVDKKNQQLVENIINISHNLRLTSVAEGVETKEQAKLLRKMGCQRFQGFYFARPMKLDALTKYLEQNHLNLV